MAACGWGRPTPGVYRTKGFDPGPAAVDDEAMSVARPTESPAQAAKLAVMVVAWLAVVHTPDAGAAMVVSAALSAHSQSVAWRDADQNRIGRP